MEIETAENIYAVGTKDSRFRNLGNAIFCNVIVIIPDIGGPLLNTSSNDFKIVFLFN